jgi:hypothetical protein
MKRAIFRPSAHLLFMVCAFLVAASALLAAGTKGKVKKGVYYSPEKNFTVPVPSGMGTRISDGYSKEGVGAVSFHDDFGSQSGIHYMRIPPDVQAKFDQAAHPADLLSHWLNNIALPAWFTSNFPTSRILHEAVVSFENMEVILAEVEIPGGSFMTVMDKDGTRRLDSLRGLIIFRRGPYIYMLTTERTNILDIGQAKTEKKAEPKEDWTKFAAGMAAFYRSISFTK